MSDPTQDIPPIKDFDDPSYDPVQSDELNFGAIGDPYPLIAEWRKLGSVLEGGYRPKMGLEPAMYPSDRKVFTVVGADEIVQALTDTAGFSNGGFPRWSITVAKIPGTGPPPQPSLPATRQAILDQLFPPNTRPMSPLKALLTRNLPK